MQQWVVKAFSLLFIIFFLNVLYANNISKKNLTKCLFLNGTLSGKVVDKKRNMPLAGATVYIADLKIGAITDATGKYFFKSLPSGTFLVEARFVGFSTITKTIKIDGTTNQDFELENKEVEESAVVVTGLSKATQIKRSPIPIISVSAAYLKQNLSTNIIDAIAKVPGVNALTTGPNVSKPFIRGLGYNRILTLYDGVRQEGQQWGDEHGIEIDEYGIEKIEVIKGPASLSYGSDAIAGVVNLIPYQPVPNGKILGNITTETQTNNGMFGGSIMLGGNKNGFEWMGRVSHKFATNYQNKSDGRVYNTAFKETDASLALGLHRHWGYSHLNFALYNDLQEIPDGSRDSLTRKFTKQITEADTVRAIVLPQELKSYAITSLHQHVQHFRVYVANNFTIGAARLAFNVGFQSSVRQEFSHPVLTDIPGLYLQLKTYSYDIKYYLPQTKGWDITAGLNGMYQNNISTNGTEMIIPNYNQFDIGPFVLVKKTFGKLDIAGGVRYDSRSFANQAMFVKPNPTTGFDMAVYGTDTIGAQKQFYAYNKVFFGISGSLGATYNFNEKFSVKINLARGFRAPNISEISSNGVHPGTNIYQIGNGNFKPEFSFQQDIGFTYTASKAVLTLSLFNNNLTNYIFNQKLVNATGSDSVIIPGNQTYQFKQGGANLYGGEMSIDIHPVKTVHFENSISTVFGRNKGINPRLQSDSNRFPPLIPPVHGISELRYNFDAKKNNIVNAFIKLQLAWYATQNRVYLTDNTETRTAGYTLINAGTGTDFINKKNKTVCSINFMANNIFNVLYQDHLSRLKYFNPYPTDPRAHGIYNMGRNFSIKVDIPLNVVLK